MRKNLSPFLLVSLVLLYSLMLPPVSTGQEVIRVPVDYPSIQKAIDAAAPGSIILVSSGMYYEHLLLNKTLKLIGVDKASTVIDGGGKIWGAGAVINVKADGVLIDGFTIQNCHWGIHLTGSNNSTINNNIITMHISGIYSENSNGSTILGNLISECGDDDGGIIIISGAVDLYKSHNNTVVGNVMVDGRGGLNLDESSNNLISRNTVTNNVDSLFMVRSDNNTIHHNNFISDDLFWGVAVEESYNNVFDDGMEGNYWSAYTGLDDGSGGRIMGDGVGDTALPYHDLDNYPLISPYSPVPIVWENLVYPVAIATNSTISTFRFTQTSKMIAFTARGPADTYGFFNITIPKSLLRDNPWKILLNGADVVSEAEIIENQTHMSIYYSYYHSNTTSYNIQLIGTWVIPEFTSILILPIFALATLIATIFLKKKRKLQPLPP